LTPRQPKRDVFLPEAKLAEILAKRWEAQGKHVVFVPEMDNLSGKVRELPGRHT
jgi:hypothetical protein